MKLTGNFGIFGNRKPFAMTTSIDNKDENSEQKLPVTGITKFIRKVNTESTSIQAISADKVPLTLKESEIIKLQEAFQALFPTVRINSTEGEVYCSRLLPFGYVIFRKGYEIRFRLNIRDGLTLMTILNNLDFDKLYYSYIRQFHGNQVQPKVLLFIPQGVNDIEKLIADYITITKNIIEKSIISISNRGVRQ